MNETKRKRIEKQILRLCAEILLRKVKNVEVGLVTFTGCALSVDGSRADVSVAVFGEENEDGKSINSLNRAAGFFRNLIGKSMGLRNAPEIHFIHDTSYEKLEKINSLIDGDD